MTPHRPALRRLALPAFAALTLFSALPSHALGRLSDIQVIDRDSGETLPVYQHRGEHWVAGRPGARYAVALRNATHGRVLGVVSVDGVNVVSGETAAWHQTGYVLGPGQRYEITGWRKSDAEVAAFHFTAAPASYAARTGRPAQVGVIGVAVFREKTPPPPVIAPQPEPYSQSYPSRERQSYAESAADFKGRAEAAGAPAPAASADSANAMAREAAPASRRMAPASPAPRLGTGHGEREGSWVGHTSFERRGERPDELIRIRYDSRENLIAMGILPTTTVPPRPNPFPGAPHPGYVPDPY
ncbi:hypothetical protein [Hydrogenophaga taeniospiralis]|uniref:hypothetical protein n=1 Tax=Hydrogenophaga taeniospiralis TaxID=65656 RepID=UPI001CFAA12B|nr:hypothetical protein [Hydrogenophaga taeniospiralis]UCU92644.1 hypothetical protein KI616_17640 [Hydrogenophaga taeniospiralis]